MQKAYLQKFYFAYIMLMIITSSSVQAESEYIPTDRYTLVKVEAHSDQKAPLTTITTLSFGANIQTIGQAIQELLQGSGYRWINPTETPNDQLLNELPLPAIDRTLGPIHLNDALETVAGEAWNLMIDETHRTVWFTSSKTKNTHS